MPIEIFENCALVSLQVRADDRGALVAIEGRRDVPFDIARIYYIFGMEKDVERGFHAHRKLNQYAVCISGSCTILVDNGTEKKSVQLTRPNQALQIGPMIWHEMRNFSPDCVLMALADAPYDEADYIRDYHEFAVAARANG